MREAGESEEYVVSIHAPAGGATKVYHVCLFDLDVSIHAPAGGATALS